MLALITGSNIILATFGWLLAIPQFATLPVLSLYSARGNNNKPPCDNFSRSPSKKETRGQNELFSLRPYRLSSVMRICSGIKISEINGIIYGCDEVSGR